MRQDDDLPAGIKDVLARVDQHIKEIKAIADPVKRRVRADALASYLEGQLAALEETHDTPISR